MRNPKILIGCPTCDRYRYCINQYLKVVKNLDYENYNLLLVDNSKSDSFFNELKDKGINIEKIEYCEPARERIVKSRNLLLDRAISGGYDYFFSLEQDIIVEPDILNKLLEHRKEIISAYYGKDAILVVQHKKTGEIKKVKIELPVVYLNEGNNKIRRANPREVLNKGLIEIGAAGLGCVLISKELFKKIRFRYLKEKKAFDDMYFCGDAQRLGYKIYLDSNIRVTHLHKAWESIEKR